ncbi:LysR family transcriptional regulator [Magnetospirillum aberrantis]|uniref:LysR family transcriptional regulator n=1 Tax=Magnetospirillum aberrantis SpK TaxID=908842 RepID=A0A7C9QWJ8_9PROT|nr:LysR family transcriptional regulator [Magnetospirillum aberrantis]NFV82242.1 LysR family transcriptional regulator [Magnetospirillum aberrantis SpK]
MMESMDMDGLRAFVAIVDSMSFSRAGETIGRSQSAISLRLRRLEQSLGVSLLVRRQGRIIELTPEGEKLLGYARQIIGLNDAALRELDSHAPCTRVRLGLPADFLDMGFTEALARIQPLVGELTVEIETDVSERLRSRCEAGELDLAFYKQAVPDGIGNTLMSLNMAWAASPDFSHSGGDLPLVCFPEGCIYRRAMLNSLRNAGIPHHPVFTTPSMDALRRAVGSGIGVTALPSALLRHDNALCAFDGLPDLDNIGLAMLVTPGGSQAIHRMADSLGDSLLSLAQH